jgi:2-dehydro-3-deoxyphosphooctonate aldolase (KDO 8-P synthase)
MPAPRHVPIGKLTLGNDRPLALIAGPCALESRSHALEMSHALVELTSRLGIGLIYKTSFDKANRTSISSNRGMGLSESLPILAEVRCRSRPSSAARPISSSPPARPAAPSM